ETSDLPVSRGLADTNGDVPMTNLLASGLVTLEDLVAKNLVGADQFDPDLEKLVAKGFLTLDDFNDKRVVAQSLVERGQVTEEDLGGLVDAAGNVNVRALVASERVTLEELVRSGLVGSRISTRTSGISRPKANSRSTTSTT